MMKEVFFAFLASQLTDRQGIAIDFEFRSGLMDMIPAQKSKGILVIFVL